MEVVTYNLRDKSGNSDNYYHKIEKLSDKVLEHVKIHAGDIINNYREFIINETGEQPRSDGEYAVELLTLGMVWNRYLGASQAASGFILCVLVRLFLLRKVFGNIKPLVDKIRGFCLGSVVTPSIGTIPVNEQITSDNLERLILWLEAAGEFKDEVKRLKLWQNFFKKQYSYVFERIILTSLMLIDWFQSVSEKELGEYLPGLKSFLEIKHKEYRFREDEVFTGKEPVEYYLNMIGSEIMNRGFREGFEKASRYVLLVPGCIRYDQDKCLATVNDLDIQCTGCNKSCRVNELTLMGKENNYDVYIIPHSSGFTQWLERWQKDKETGLIAVACLLNLVPGGYEMRELGLNAQCVLLDYCGCKKHWHDEGISTDLNENRILELINKI